MLGKVLWAVDNELDSTQFERLSIDLLYRTGFKDIIPVEPQDGGRDAEELPRMGRGRAGELAFFQFSKEEDWRDKVRRDSRKLASRGYEFSTLVFVTNRKARGVDKDSMAAKIREKYGWDLLMFSREWFRHQLEEVHPDLAKKYLAIDVPDWSAHLAARIRFEGSPEVKATNAWVALDAKEYERAIPEFRSLLAQNPESRDAWEALAWCQYCIHQYDQALTSINRAQPSEEAPQAFSIRACILAEKAIRDGSRTMLIEAREAFESLASSGKRPIWTTPYNLGNVLSSLGQYRKAVTWYERALGLNAGEPTIMKNLATAHHHIGNHEKELELLDDALAIDPLMPQALVSKAICLLVDFDDASSAIPLLEKAIKFNKDWSVRWPQVWYWTAQACMADHQLDRAFEWVQDGLSHQPGYCALRQLKLQLLRTLAPVNPAIAADAKSFWRNRLEEEPLDFDTRTQLVQQEEREGNLQSAWAVLDDSFDALDSESGKSLSCSGFSVREAASALMYLPQYARYRKFCPVSRYWEQADPLYDLPFPPPDSSSAVDALFTSLSVAFGLGFKSLEDVSPNKREATPTLKLFFDNLRQLIERSLVESAREFAPLIPSSDQGNKAVADKVSNVIMFLGLIALREFGSQRGWILSQFRVPEAAMNAALDGYDEAAIEAKVVSNALISLNDAVGFLPP